MKKLLNALKKHSLIPMHMPGHKRNLSKIPFLKDLCGDIDITEIDGFDNLAHPESILKDYMDKASKLWNTKKSYFLVGGSTCGILAGIRSLTNSGDTVLISRASHKSVYNALELCNLKVKFLKGEIYNNSVSNVFLDPQDVLENLENDPKIKLVMITSPTYEGNIQPVSQIAKICHRYNIPLMVDEAHGSHLGFSEYFEGGAVANGADYVVQSLHKTSLGLTQTAIAHINGDLVDLQKLEHNLSIFQTSSPSYILMASICECIDFLENNENIFDDWAKMLEEFYDIVRDLKHISVQKRNNCDKSKILIDCSKANINGNEMMNILREEYSIELEMAYGDIALAMTGLGEDCENLKILADSLHEIDKGLKFQHKEVFALKTYESKPQISVKEALESEKKIVKKEEAIGKVSGSHIWVYPPGIPIVMAGEIIKKEAVQIIENLESKNSEILDSKNAYPSYIILD